uniref:Uncharacterized protein n=1 Tax=Cacopsylla melanoneura TaxID=428564 RepID=A0A8D9DPD9_9HEMI
MLGFVFYVIIVKFCKENKENILEKRKIWIGRRLIFESETREKKEMKELNNVLNIKFVIYRKTLIYKKENTFIKFVYVFVLNKFFHDFYQFYMRRVLDLYIEFFIELKDNVKFRLKYLIF